MSSCPECVHVESQKLIVRYRHYPLPSIFNLCTTMIGHVFPLMIAPISFLRCVAALFFAGRQGTEHVPQLRAMCLGNPSVSDFFLGGYVAIKQRLTGFGDVIMKQQLHDYGLTNK